MKRSFSHVAPRPFDVNTADNIPEWTVLQPEPEHVHESSGEPSTLVDATSPSHTSPPTPAHATPSPHPERWLQVHPWGWCSVLYNIIWAPSTFTWDYVTARWLPSRWCYVRPWIDYDTLFYTAEEHGTYFDNIDIDMPYPDTDTPYMDLQPAHGASPTAVVPPHDQIHQHQDTMIGSWYKISGWGWCCVQHDILWRPSHFEWDYHSNAWTPSRWMYVRPIYP